MTVKHKCSEKTWRRIGHFGDWYPCSRPATVERNSKWYCWQHDPLRVEADKKKRRARWDAKHDRKTARWERRERNAKLAALVTVETAELLEALANAMDEYRALGFSQITYSARTLAASIREALEVNDEG